ncbi:DUF1656 domain-containing protein [Asaia lannensis]|uniref:DUF1656 domain-containing protein n=1 Tax=Asaia lannensis NBRC 102526 TaxID=1307926 RepID=A0ABT1CEP5_9PROT|nr:MULTISPECIES: DUF1656 domain-containing protein [Asaia]ETC98346.1 hypothetical protein P792_10215 [Asaia sp. SF2.1]MCO6158504.1 DUF1656 domain-containing protein [Asaia lannensis NBRC 102526]GBR01015.1 hypothetical protein AA102526_2379 [Asaia lannensis NBRC 102526]
MIPDLCLSGVYIPGFFIVTCLALLMTVTALHLFSITGASRWFTTRSIVEIAVFIILLGLLVRAISIIGPHP